MRNCQTGMTALVSLAIAAVVLAKTKSCRAWVSAAVYVPAMLSSILLLAPPWSDRWELESAI